MKTKIQKILDYSIIFDNGTTLTSVHGRECCEKHYIDFSHITLEEVKDLEFDLSNDKFFNRIPNYGIELVPLNGFPVRVPGYGYNNGYYSANITLVLGKQFDVTECQKWMRDTK